MNISYAYAGAMYCAECAAALSSPQPVINDESDTPTHCDTCGGFLENRLTSDGVEYVARRIIDNIIGGAGNNATIDTWFGYYGSELSCSDMIRTLIELRSSP